MSTPGTGEHRGEAAGAGGRLRLSDLAGLVAGFGLSALLVRAFWSKPGVPEPLVALALATEYAWMGLAMAGPFVLGNRLRGAAGAPDGSLTGPELAWLLIGGYWVGLALLVMPTRMSIGPMLAVAPIALIVALGRLVRAPKGPATPDRPWTRRAAAGLLASWPLAWGLLIYLAGKLE